MRAEVYQALEAIQAALEIQDAVSQNTAVDTLDLNTLVVPVEDLANEAFAQSGLSAAARIARREAYDLVHSLHRLVEISTLTRSSHYALATGDFAKLDQQAEYLKAALMAFELYGTR